MTVLKRDRSEGVLLLTLNRPDRRNALNQASISALDDAVTEATADPEIGAVVVTGAGRRAFCAGADITQLNALEHTESMAWIADGQRVFARLEQLGVPTLAAVNGYALGGGCELAMACDLRWAARSAQLGQPEITLANIPGWGATQRLPRIVGPGKAKHMIFTGEAIDSDEALRVGLVDRVVADDQLLPSALAYARRLAALPRDAIRWAKHAMQVGFDHGPDAGYQAELHGVRSCMSSDEQRTATTAFLSNSPSSSSEGAVS